MRRLLALVLAFGSAVVTALLVRGWIERDAGAPSVEAAPEPAPRREVLVAARTLEPGTLLEAGDLAWRPWPEEALDDAFWVDREIDRKELAGAVVRRAVPAGMPVARDDVVRPGERGFLAAVLEPGFVGLTIPVDEAFAEAGVVFPGDRVDVLLSQRLGDERDERPVVETLVRDVRVVAIGSRLQPASEAGADLPRQRRTATLELRPRDAQRVALALDMGRIVLAVRALARAGARSEGPGPLWAEDVSRARAHGRAIAVYRGDDDRVEALPVPVPAAAPVAPSSSGSGDSP